MNSTQPARLRFLGATDTVTGSRFLLESGDTRILVDCGHFQGYKRIRYRNRIPFPVPPASIDAALLTHAHLDHTGYVPALVRDGFTGPIYATHGTSELCKLVLPDSGHLQEEEVRYADHRGSSVHVPALPVYTAADAVRSLNAFEPRGFDAPLDLGAGIEATFLPAGHILGAAQIHLNVDGHSIHFTGDLGRADDPLMFPPRELEAADILVTESTYGNRTHPDQDPAAELGSVVSRVAKRGGVIMIAAFAVGRAETLMLHLTRLRRKHLIPDTPIYLNSPMAIDASYMYRQHPDEHRLLVDEFEDMYKLATMTRTADDSKLLNPRGGLTSPTASPRRPMPCAAVSSESWAGTPGSLNTSKQSRLTTCSSSHGFHQRRHRRPMMALSEHEKKTLEQIAQELERDDPKFASKMRSASGPAAARHTAFGIFTAVLGCFVLLTGVAARTPALGIIGFTIMSAGAYLATKRLGSPRIRWRPSSSPSMGSAEKG